MKFFLFRVLSLALISLAIAMTFLPFNNNRSASVEQEVVSLQKIELLNPDKISEQYPDIEIKDITGPELNPDDYPDLFSAFLNLGEDWINESCELPEWNRFKDSVLRGNATLYLLVFRNKLTSDFREISRWRHPKEIDWIITTQSIATDSQMRSWGYIDKKILGYYRPEIIR